MAAFLALCLESRTKMDGALKATRIELYISGNEN